MTNKMKKTIEQLMAIEELRNTGYLEILSVGYYTNGDLGVHLKDEYGDYSTTINKQGKILK